MHKSIEMTVLILLTGLNILLMVKTLIFTKVELSYVGAGSAVIWLFKIPVFGLFVLD